MGAASADRGLRLLLLTPFTLRPASGRRLRTSWCRTAGQAEAPRVPPTPPLAAPRCCAADEPCAGAEETRRRVALSPAQTGDSARRAKIVRGALEGRKGVGAGSHRRRCTHAWKDPACGCPRSSSRCGWRRQSRGSRGRRSMESASEEDRNLRRVSRPLCTREGGRVGNGVGGDWGEVVSKPRRRTRQRLHAY